MAKANSRHTTPKQNPDAELLAMIERHDKLWTIWDDNARAADVAWQRGDRREARKLENDPRLDPIRSETRELEYRIVTTSAFTNRGLAGKKRVAKRACFSDREGIVAAGLEFDAERVAAGKRTRAKPQAAGAAAAA
jgi:hypothetical protein